MNGLVIKTTHVIGLFTLYRGDQLLSATGAPFLLLQWAGTRLLEEEKRWLAETYPEWASLKPGEWWPKKAGK